MSVRRRHKVDKNSPRSIVIQRRSLTLESHTRSSLRLGIRQYKTCLGRISLFPIVNPLRLGIRQYKPCLGRISLFPIVYPLRLGIRQYKTCLGRISLFPIVNASGYTPPKSTSVRYGPIHGHWSSTSGCTEITRHLGRSPQRRDIPLLFLWEHRHTSPRPFNIISNAATRHWSVLFELFSQFGHSIILWTTEYRNFGIAASWTLLSEYGHSSGWFLKISTQSGNCNSITGQPLQSRKWEC